MDGHRLAASPPAQHSSEPLSLAAKESRIAANQLRIAGELLVRLAPSFGADAHLPSRLREAACAREYNSSNRRLFTELLFTVVRHWAWLAGLEPKRAVAAAAWLAETTPEVTRLRLTGALADHGLPVERPESLEGCRVALEQFAGVPLCSIASLARPDWMELSHSSAPCLSRPPLYIRLQNPSLLPVLRSELQQISASLSPTLLHSCFRVDPASPGTVDATSLPCFAQGAFEVQDIGSQALLLAAQPRRAGTRWLDACAGGGGKSLQLAALLGPSCSVRAEDVRGAALRRLTARARRAGLEECIHTAVVDGDSNVVDCSTLFDGVLVDAPCTGSGTWRRSPHLRWQLSPEQLAAAAELQLAILRRASARVRPGGLLLYATCSQAAAENEGVCDRFLASAEGAAYSAAELPGAASVAALQRAMVSEGRLCLPPGGELDGDGLFLAAFQKG
jgi:16S rRNA (cytosine967-C5)-methyltransferase